MNKINLQPQDGQQAQAFNPSMTRRQLLEGGIKAAGATLVAATFADVLQLGNVEAAGNLPRTPEQAAHRYSASSATRNARLWDMHPFNHGKTMDSHFQGSPDGATVRMNTRGAVLDGYWDLKTTGNIPESHYPGLGTMSFVIKGKVVPQADVRKTSTWEGYLVNAKHVRKQQIARDQKQQPWALFIPVGFEQECEFAGPPVFVESKEHAAHLFGVQGTPTGEAKYWNTWNNDSDPNRNLRVSGAFFDVKYAAQQGLKDDGGHFKFQNLNRASAYEGSFEVKDDGEVPYYAGKGHRDEGFVSDGEAVPVIYARGISAYSVFTLDGRPEDRTTSVNRLWLQRTSKEPSEQPGTIVYPFGFTPGANACPTN